MGLDIYVGSLTRYLSGDWELVAQTVARELGADFRVIRSNDPSDAIRDPDAIRPVVERWRSNLSAVLAPDLPAPLVWDESPRSPYFTDKPAWDGYAALILWGAYEEQSHLVRPVEAVQEWADDPAYKISCAADCRSRYSQLLDVSLWLPCDFRFVFRAESVTGGETLMGSSVELSRQLGVLNERTWRADDALLRQWRKDGSDHGAPLETAARFAFSIFKDLADQSAAHKLPMLMDW